MHRTLISSDLLEANLTNQTWVIIDCRFDLSDTTSGEQSYKENHIPGAVYAHLDRDLSGPPTGRNGRHPLPVIAVMEDTFGKFGINHETQGVAYDKSNGIFASRLWWMLRYLGHDAVAVLDGGITIWNQEAKPLQTAVERRAPVVFTANPHPDMLVGASQVQALLSDSTHRILDARSPDRYAGGTEPLDSVAGHIPGAMTHHYANNVTEDGSFIEPVKLRLIYDQLLHDVQPSRLVCYCGSGVTACHNLLAMEHAGLSGAKLYAGSWSEWCSDPRRPVARKQK